MNTTERTITCLLIAELDDTRTFYARLAPLLAHRQVKSLVQQLVESQSTIIDDLAGQLDRTGAFVAPRRWRVLARLRARIARRIAVAGAKGWSGVGAFGG